MYGGNNDFGIGAAMGLLMMLLVYVLPIGGVTLFTLVAALFFGTGIWMAIPIVSVIVLSLFAGKRFRI